MNLLKQILPYALLILVTGLWLQTCQQAKNDKSQFESNLKIKDDSVKHFKDKTGQLVSEKESILITAKDLKEQGELLGIDNKNLKDQVGNLNNLVSYYKGQLTAKGQGKVKGKDTVIVKVRGRDTVHVVDQKFHFTNKYLTFDALYDHTIDSLNFKYNYKVDLQLTNFHTKRKYLIVGPRQTYADMRLSDPNATMTSAQSIVIDQPPPPLYERTWFDVLVGTIFGIFIVSKL